MTIIIPNLFNEKPRVGDVVIVRRSEDLEIVASGVLLTQVAGRIEVIQTPPRGDLLGFDEGPFFATPILRKEVVLAYAESEMKRGGKTTRAQLAVEILQIFWPFISNESMRGELTLAAERAVDKARWRIDS